MEQREPIELRGARENNLKNINIDIPKEKLVVLVGVSGSGKSSLAFETLASESNRQWQETYPLFVRSRLPRHKRPDIDQINNLTPCIVVDQRPIGSNSRSSVGTAVDVAPLLRLLFSRVGKPSAGGSMAYSFNHPHGMCPDCTGLGERVTLDENKLYDKNLSINEGAIKFSQFYGGSWQEFYYTHNPLYSADKKLIDFDDDEWKAFRIGPDEPLVMDYIRNNTGQVSKLPYEGVVARFNRLYINRDISGLKKSVQDEALKFIKQEPCPTCGGSGLNPLALASKINGYNIAELSDMQVSELIEILDNISDPLGSSIAGQINLCLSRMVRVGLGYLSLSRRTDSLSGGEAQRIKLVRHLSSNLSNITYILDEPTAGLHPSDVKKIGDLLIELRDAHNTVVVVEHNKQIMEIADHIIELGPLAGTKGGSIVYEGKLSDLLKEDTATANAIKSKPVINSNTRSFSDSYKLESTSLHNLKNVTVDIPKGVLTVVSGVAGSGKSSLCEAFISQHPEAIVVDQGQIGISSRSTSATYTGIMDDIRKLFAKENKVSAQWFSSNSKGACPVCKGKGEVMPEVAFADPVAILCEECGGHRFNPTALSYKYQSKNIEEVLQLTVTDALDFFTQIKITDKLKLLEDVGLGYMTLGQPTSTMSGGEIQRLKLANELHNSGNIYILDEPSAGLHSSDAKKVRELMNYLIELGNTVIVAEHQIDMIASADWVIDMGPGSGSEGGNIVFSGTPGELTQCVESHTGKYLKNYTE